MEKENGGKRLSRLDELRAKYGYSAPSEVQPPRFPTQSDSPPERKLHAGASRHTFFFYRGIRPDGSIQRFPRLWRVIFIPSAVLLLIGTIFLSFAFAVGVLIILAGLAITALTFALFLLWMLFGYSPPPFEKQTRLERWLNEPVYWTK
ncbi:MAG TPA: hypothetical protein DIW46_06475 [Microbacterium sp.]|nr:hypothetical protein [Microbacterium sp.]